MVSILRIYKKTSFFICALYICIVASSAQASTKILVWGDSLSAAYGIPVKKGWVNLMQEKLGDNAEIINGSISGETTQGGLTRLPAALQNHMPNLVILALGANDGLRGISPQISKRNLEQMILKSKQAGAEIALLGIKIPPNYGPAYTEKFEEQFVTLASDYQLPFIPFFLENIVGKSSNFQADQLHPTAEAQPLILETILPVLETALKGKFDSTPRPDANENPTQTTKEEIMTH